MTNSFMPVDQTAQAGTVNTQKPYISRASLKAEESAAFMDLELTLKMKNFAQLQTRVARGERISATEMADKYEPTAKDYQVVVNWAKAQGLTIVRMDSHHLSLFVRARVGEIARILHTNFARVIYRGREFTSAITAPSVPADLSDVLLGINGLQPHLRPHKHLIKKQAQPNAVSGGAEYLPAQIAQAYGASSLYSNSITGSGQTIAVVIDTFPATSDLTLFWQKAGLTQESLSNVQFVQVVAGQLPDPSGEESLDVEWATGMAPGAKVRVYAATDLASTDLDQSYQQILDDATNHPELNIHQMTMSYGSGESDTPDSELDTDAQLFAELAAAGVTCFASSGDGGSTPDDNGGTNGSLQPENPASDPSVTGVGGTSLILNSSNNITSETVWTDGGGGTSAHFARPSWQTGTGVSLTAKRQVPDIACTADPQFGGVVYLNGRLNVFGGTSWASPVSAAFCALLNQSRANVGQAPIGLLGPNIYPLIGTAALRDITSGTNATANSNGKYTAKVGYDECSGVGSFKMLALAAQLAGSNALVGIQMPAALQELAPGRTASFTVSVAGASATYQWQRQPIGGSSFSNVSNGGAYSGATTATLTIANVTTAMSGDQFQCVIQLPSSTVTTAPPSNLVVETPLAVTTLAGSVQRTGLSGTTGFTARFNYPSGIALDSAGDLYIADYGNNQIRKVTTAGTVSTPFGNINGSPGSSNGTSNGALFNGPNGIAVDSTGNFYVADSGNDSIRKITGTTVSTLPGSFNMPLGVAVDSAGNVYVADTGNDTIRKITPGGTVTVFAGETGVSGFADGSATGQALFNAPQGVAVDGSGNVYVADFGNCAIRKISGGTVTTISGTGGYAGYLDGRAASALFNAPTGLAFDTSGNLYITDALVPSSSSNAVGNCLLRKLSPAGVVSTVAGNPGVDGSSDGTGSAAEFFSVQAVAVDPTGPIYVADTYNQTIREADASSASTLSRATVALTNLVATYDGTTKSAVATTTPTGLTVNITYNGSSTPPTSAGSYAVVATISDPDYIGSTSGTMVIRQATAPVTLGSLAATYNGSQHAATATTTPNGLTVNFTYNNSTTPPTAVGSYTVVGTVIDTNYTGTATSMLIISKGTASVTLGNLAAAYDGTAKTVTVTTSPVGLSVAVTYAGSTRAPSAPGTYPVVATVNDVNLAGSASGTLVITPGTATVTLGSLSAVYNGRTHAATATTVPGRLAVVLTYNGSATAPTVVGNYAVVATINNPDYTGSANGTLTISPIAPLATTSAATGAGASVATLNGSVNPEGSTTTVTFEYGTTTAYGHTTAGQNVGNGTVAVTPTAAISGLAPQTLYHYHVVAASAGGTIPGADKTFTTLAVPTFAAANTAQSFLAATGAQVSFSVNPNGLATSVYFQYGTTTAFGSQTALQSIGSGTTAVNVLAFLSGLQPGTMYHFQMVTVSAAGTFFGPDETFTTLPFDTTLVVQTGDAAVGVSGGTFATFGNGAVNSQDGVAFAAQLTATRAGPVTSANSVGIWAEDNTLTRQLVARTAGTAPGASGATYVSLTDPVYNNSEEIAFGGGLNSARGTTAGVWSSSSGTLALLARQGSQAPGIGAGGTFAAFAEMAITDGAGTILAATLNNNATAGVTTATSAGIWEGNTTADLALMLRLGDAVGGKTISAITFLPTTETIVNGQTRGFGPSTGHIVCNTTFSDKTTGIVEVLTPEQPQIVAKATDTAAGTIGATFATFSSAAINDNDHTAFAAMLAVSVGDTVKTNASGIWADDSGGTRQLVARLGGIAPGTGTNATFLTLSDPAYNSNDAIAFRGTLSVGTGLATAATASGIWCNSTGSLALVAQQGVTQAPGCPTGATFSAFTELALDDPEGATHKGGVIFLATLNPNATAAVTASNNTGIWAVDKSGTLQLIVRTGDVLNGKTVTALALLPTGTIVNGQARSFSKDTGDLVFNATFSDKTTAMFNVVYP